MKAEYTILIVLPQRQQAILKIVLFTETKGKILAEIINRILNKDKIVVVHTVFDKI